MGGGGKSKKIHLNKSIYMNSTLKENSRCLCKKQIWEPNTCPILSENEQQWFYLAELKGDTFGSFESKRFTAGKTERPSSCLASHGACLSRPTEHTEPRLQKTSICDHK